MIVRTGKHIMAALALLLATTLASNNAIAAGSSLKTLVGEVYDIQPGSIVVAESRFPLRQDTPVYTAKGTRTDIRALRNGMKVEIVFTFPGYAVQVINIR